MYSLRRAANQKRGFVHYQAEPHRFDSGALNKRQGLLTHPVMLQLVSWELRSDLTCPTRHHLGHNLSSQSFGEPVALLADPPVLSPFHRVKLICQYHNFDSDLDHMVLLASGARVLLRGRRGERPSACPQSRSSYVCALVGLHRGRLQPDWLELARAFLQRSDGDGFGRRSR